jgi:hypothetical protein
MQYNHPLHPVHDEPCTTKSLQKIGGKRYGKTKPQNLNVNFPNHPHEEGIAEDIAKSLSLPAFPGFCNLKPETLDTCNRTFPHVLFEGEGVNARQLKPGPFLDRDPEPTAL